MNRVILSGTISAKEMKHEMFWVETYERSYALIAFPEAYAEGMDILENGDEVVVEGVVRMSPQSSGGNTAAPTAVADIRATRLEAVRPSNRAKKVNHLWYRLNNQRARLDHNAEETLESLANIKNDAYRLKAEVATAKAEVQKVRKEAGESILALMAGGDDD